MGERPIYSIVVPMYNEELVINEMYRRVSAVMDDLGEAWELILVNDGSSDRTLDLMMALRAQHPNVRVISFARNFGHQIAVTAGMDYATGDAVVIIDADLQDPPEVIPELIEKWRGGYQVVYAVRAERRGESWFKLFTARLFYRLVYRITDVDIPLDTGDFRLMDRSAVDAMSRMREHHRFLRGMASWVGFTQIGVEYVREERFAGKTKYPLRKMLQLAFDAITGFSYFPLKIAIYASLFLGIIAVLGVPVVAILRLATGKEVFEGQATTLVVLLLVSSFQFLFFFLLGQYVARIYDEVRDRPLYIVAQALGFDEEPVVPGAGHHLTATERQPAGDAPVDVSEG